MYSDKPLKAITNVPKTVSLLICHGCGRKTWFNADGRPMHKFKGLWYCSETCATIDWEFGKWTCM